VRRSQVVEVVEVHDGTAEESAAWRQYACAALQGVLASGETELEHAAHVAALIADYLLEAERRRPL
jgi:hypothetical protein